MYQISIILKLKVSCQIDPKMSIKIVKFTVVFSVVGNEETVPFDHSNVKLLTGELITKSKQVIIQNERRTTQGQKHGRNSRKLSPLQIVLTQTYNRS